MIKIKNSDLCLCGSGKLFKSCCKGKVNMCKKNYEDDVLNNPNRLNHLLQQKMKATDYKICFHPEQDKCKLPIKNAHTLQNNGVLSIVAEKNHVMVTDLFNKVRGGSVIRKVSKNDATTFYGFCEYHDSVIFKDIELIEYNNQIKQNFLYAYRTCAQEYHKKTRAIKVLQQCFKDNPGVFYMEGFIENYRYTELSYFDVKSYMDKFDKSLINNNFDVLENYVFEFSDIYDFAVTTMFNPAYDLVGNEINDLYSTEKENLKSIFLSIIPTKNKFYMILSCLREEYSKLEAYFNQVKNLNEQELKVFLNNVLPTFSENIVLSPRLWERWTPFSKREYEKIINGGIGEFEKIISGGMPYESIDDFVYGMQVKDGMNNMMTKQRYDLFKK